MLVVGVWCMYGLLVSRVVGGWGTEREQVEEKGTEGKEEKEEKDGIHHSFQEDHQSFPMVDDGVLPTNHHPTIHFPIQVLHN